MATPLASAAPPRRARNLAEFVVGYVTDQIASNALKPGDKLPTESQLMVTLSVSRTVIREAISRLQAGKIIETRHGIGSFVLEPQREKLGIDMVPATTLRDVLSILELRISLETECAGLAAQRAKPDDLARMRTALDAIEATRHNGLDSVDADLQFHISVARATGNRYFVDILTQMGSALIRATGSTRRALRARSRMRICRSSIWSTKAFSRRSRGTTRKARARQCACICPTAASG